MREQRPHHKTHCLVVPAEYQYPAMTRAAVFSLLLSGVIPLQAHPEIEESLTRLNEQIAANPDRAEPYLERGEVYARHGDWLSAEANYLRAAELEPKLPRLDRALAALALATGRTAEAAAHLDRALAVDPQDADALLLRARAHSATGRRDAALADLNAVLELVANPPAALYLERAALISSVPAAVRSLDEGLTRLGPNVLVLQLRALALEETSGDIEAALARLDRIAQQSERQEIWLKRRGDMLTRAGRREEARAAYSAALEAIATLPEWLRELPDTARLAGELTRLIGAAP